MKRCIEQILLMGGAAALIGSVGAPSNGSFPGRPHRVHKDGAPTLSTAPSGGSV